MTSQILTNHLKMHSQFLIDLRAGKVELTQSALDDQIKIIDLSIQYSDAMEKQIANYKAIDEKAKRMDLTRAGGRLQ